MSDATYDIAIIGAGSGGMTAARRAKNAGLSVVLFDAGAVGGTCVNVGCVPKKLLVQASRARDGFASAPLMGWAIAEPEFDWPTLRDAVLTEVGRLAQLHRKRLEDSGVTFVNERAMIERPGIVLTDNGRRVAARSIVIATGARPVVPNLRGADRALVSDNLFHLTSLPKSMGIIGGGYIAVEFACMLHRFGVAVTLFEMGSQLIEGFDADVATRLHRSMVAQGIDVRLDQSVAEISYRADCATLTLERGGEVRVEEVLLAVGRRANTDGLGLAELGIELDFNGTVAVDPVGRTNVPGIHAIGDAAGGMMLTPVAIADAKCCIDAILGQVSAAPGRIVPTATFTTPECASVGLTEPQAQAADLSFDVRRKEFSGLASALSASPEKIFMKALIGTDDGRLLGLHFFGPHAAEAAQMGAVALSAGLTERELSRTMSLHPSTAEEVIGLGDADMPIHDPAPVPQNIAAE